MQSYKRLILWTYCFFIFYVLIAVYGKPEPTQELFPFFDWSLFSNRGQIMTDLTIRIRTINGQNLDSPKLYYQMKGVFGAARRGDPVLPKLIDRLATAIILGERDKIISLRELLERRYFKEVESAEYDLVRLRYQPIERFETGKIRSVEVIATFEKTSAP